MHAKPGLRVVLKWMIADSGSVIADVIRLRQNQMDIADLAMSIGFFATPPLLLFVVHHRLRAVFYSVITLWLLMIVGGQYHLAYTPGYDSFAPGLTIVIGWLPSCVYTLIWLGVFALFNTTPRTDNVD